MEKIISRNSRWIRSRLSFAILRATNLCLRGSRTKWRSGAAMVDGAGLPERVHKVAQIYALLFYFSIHIISCMTLFYVLCVV